MAEIKWHESGQKRYSLGVSQGVLYTTKSKRYDTAEAWNGLKAIKEAPEGGEPTQVFADNTNYATVSSAEKFNATIEAYTCPDTFFECDGTKEIAKGVQATMQERKEFGLSYRTEIGNDVAGQNAGYIIHLVYGCIAKPSSRDHNTINDSPEISSLSWELSTTPVAVPNSKPSSHLMINSTKTDPGKLAILEAVLYGRTGVEMNSTPAGPRLPMPEEVATILGTD